MLIPINNHNGNNIACLPMLTTATHIKLPQSSIPKDGNNGENGTLKGLSLSGSVFLKIKTLIQTIINAVNTLNIQSWAARFKSKNKQPIIIAPPTSHVIT